MIRRPPRPTRTDTLFPLHDALPISPNSWAPMSGDEALGMVYVPTGNATPDFFGGNRRSFDDRYSSSVLALDAETGDLRWSFQSAHHDVWDYDVASQPTLEIGRESCWERECHYVEIVWVAE